MKALAGLIALALALVVSGALGLGLCLTGLPEALAEMSRVLQRKAELEEEVARV
jgi:hypothetical protein